MSEWIEKEEVLKQIDCWLMTGEYKYSNATHYLDKRISSIKPKERDWILVKDRLPEKGEDVLVWFEYYRYGRYDCLYQTYGIGTHCGHYKSWVINGKTEWRELRVIAWMPLPEKPESEDVK